MKTLMWNESCPDCKLGDYTVESYEESNTPSGIEQTWYCKCDNCRTRFTIQYFYEMVGKTVSMS